jgi:hypothetical protein
MITGAITLPQTGATIIFILLAIIGIFVQTGLSRRTNRA